MRVYLGTDHAGFELKVALVAWLGEAGHEAVDCGPVSYDADDDYPVYVLRAAKGVADDPGSLGIVIGGSGNGEQIAANKVPGIRAALAWTQETARLAREHNDANVLSLGARQYSRTDAVSLAKVFIETPFSGEPRHIRRLAMIAHFEKTGELPELAPAAPPPGGWRGHRTGGRARRHSLPREFFLPRGGLGEMLRMRPRHVPRPHRGRRRDLANRHSPSIP